MKKISLAIALLCTSLFVGAQTFTVTTEGLLPQSWWPIVVNEQDAVINCPQAGFMDKLESKGAFRNSGTFVEGLAQANLGNIKQIIFAPGVTKIDLSTRTQLVTKLCANDVKITGPVDGSGNPLVTISVGNNSGYNLFTFAGNNIKVSNLNFNTGKTFVTGSNDTIVNCVFTQNSDKFDLLVLKGSTNAYVANNKFIGLNAANDRHALYVTNGATNSLIYNNTFTDVFNALYSGNYPGDGNIGTSTNTIFRKNTIQSVSNNGIYFYTGSKTALIDSNTLTNSKYANIYIRDLGANSGINILNNSSSGSIQSSGIFIENSENLTIKYNKVFSNFSTGIHVESSSTNTKIINNNAYNNNDHGIENVSSNNPLIDSNYVYGNTKNGIVVSNSNSSTVTNNKVGIDNLGNISGNKYNGIEILGGQNHRIGTPNNGNIIVASGNGVLNDKVLNRNNGIRFGLSGGVLPTNSSIKSNYIGVDTNGTQSVTLGSNRSGIFFENLAASLATNLNDTVGGYTKAEANVIGNNGTCKGAGTAGIQISDFNRGIFVIGNYVGISDKLTSVSNFFDGILVRGADHNYIINNIVGNNMQGISLRYNVASSQVATAQSSFNVVKGNYCGTSNGIDAHPNTDIGLSVEWGANNNLIGGGGANDSNIVMNEKVGVWVAGTNASSTKDTIWGNKISNCSNAGIQILNTSSSLVIKGNQINTSAIGIDFSGAANNASVLNNNITASTTNGISIAAAITNATFTNNIITNTIDGNGINVSAAATNMAIRNNTITGNKFVGVGLQPTKGNGIYMTAGKTSIIGGTDVNEGNTITDNQTDGISLNGIATNNIMMRRNIIACNAGTGINLNASANTNYMLDIIRVDTNASTVNSITGILKGQTTKDVIIEVFGPSIACRQSCNSAFGRQGYAYLGTTTTDDAGKWTLTLGAPIALGDVAQITATATTPTALNIAGAFVTSEFSRCNDILPVEFLSFTAVKNQNGVMLSWKTATETNNDYFLVERSIDGIHFTAIGAPVKGAGTSLQVNAYQLLDVDPADGVNYYRIRQVDYDGKFDFSDVKVVNLAGASMVTVSPNPSNGHFAVKIISESTSLFVVEIFNALGQIIYTKTLSLTGGYAEQKVNLDHVAAGVYTLVVKNDSDTWVNKVIKE